MTSDASSTAAVTAAVTTVLRYHVQFASLALLYYDYSLTWTREVKYFWRRKPNLSTLLYFFCRYALVSNVIYTLAMAGKLKYMSCDTAYKLCIVLSLCGRVGIMVTWGARTYAVFNQNKWVLALFTALGLTVFILTVMQMPYVTCGHSRGSPLGIPPQLLAIMTTVFEIVAAVLTTVRIIQTLMLTQIGTEKRKSLSRVLLEQGSLYIGFVSFFSVGTIILLNVKETKGTFLERLLNALTIPISGLMTCRFLLQLREWEHTSSGAYSTNNAAISVPLRFREIPEDDNNEETDYDTDDSESVLTWSDEIRNDPLFNIVGGTMEEPIGPNRV